jgi:hypothetical protein
VYKIKYIPLSFLPVQLADIAILLIVSFTTYNLKYSEKKKKLRVCSLTNALTVINRQRVSHNIKVYYPDKYDETNKEWVILTKGK